MIKNSFLLFKASGNLLTIKKFVHSQCQIMEQEAKVNYLRLIWVQDFGNIWRNKIYQRAICLKDVTILQGGVGKSSHRTFSMDSSEGFCDLSL